MLPLTIPRLLLALPRSAAVASAFIGPINQTLAESEISTIDRISMFLAQAGHESADLTVLRENLNYSAERLVAVWPNRFRLGDGDPADGKANAYEYGNPEKIANRVYADRLGNGNEESGDGWAYRGGGIFQLTGRKNFELCSIAIAGDADTLLKNPELIVDPNYAAPSAGWFWRTRSLNIWADRRDVETCTKRINGGTIGLAERRANFDRIRAALAA